MCYLRLNISRSATLRRWLAVVAEYCWDEGKIRLVLGRVLSCVCVAWCGIDHDEDDERDQQYS